MFILSDVVLNQIIPYTYTRQFCTEYEAQFTIDVFLMIQSVDENTLSIAKSYLKCDGTAITITDNKDFGAVSMMIATHPQFIKREEAINPEPYFKVYTWTDFNNIKLSRIYFNKPEYLKESEPLTDNEIDVLVYMFDKLKDPILMDKFLDDYLSNFQMIDRDDIWYEWSRADFKQLSDYNKLKGAIK